MYLLEHLQEFPKFTPDLDILARLKKLISNNSLCEVSIFSHLPNGVEIYAYMDLPNLKVEGREQE